MKKILLFALPLLAMIALSCQKDNGELSGDDIIEFKDPNFLKALLTDGCTYDYDSNEDDYFPYDIDYNKDGKISVNEAQKVKALVLSEESFNITAIPEIKYFTALEFLYCCNKPLASLDVSKCVALKELVCAYNQLTTLDLSNNTALTNLTCDGNQLTSLDLKNNIALTRLECEGNQLTSLDVSRNTALTNLQCSDNQLTSIDVSNNTALTNLQCSDNQLTSLDLRNQKKLISLYCSNNPLKTIYLPKYHLLAENIMKSLEAMSGLEIIYVE